MKEPEAETAEHLDGARQFLSEENLPPAPSWVRSQLPGSLVIRVAEVENQAAAITLLERAAADFGATLAGRFEAARHRLLWSLDRPLNPGFGAFGAWLTPMPSDLVTEPLPFRWSLDLTKDIIGQAVHAGLLLQLQPRAHRLALGSGELPRLLVVYGQFRIEHGSLKTGIRLAIQGPLELVILVLATLAADEIGDWQEEVRFQGEVSAIVEGEACSAEWGFSFEISDLDRLGAEALDYNRADLTDTERTAAVCYVQLALHLAGFDPGPIDGIPGPRTTFALGGYAEAEGVEPGIGDDTLRLRLARTLRISWRQL